MKTVFNLIAPRFDHDCTCCTFVGFDGPTDVYFHGDTVIRRFSDDGPDYYSMPMNIAHRIPDYDVAMKLVDEELMRMEISA